MFAAIPEATPETDDLGYEQLDTEYAFEPIPTLEEAPAVQPVPQPEIPSDIPIVQIGAVESAQGQSPEATPMQPVQEPAVEPVAPVEEEPEAPTAIEDIETPLDHKLQSDVQKRF